MNNYQLIQKNNGRFFGRISAGFRFILEKLSSRPQIDGLEASDGALRYVFFEYGIPKTVALRLSPGVLKNGKIQDAGRLLEYFKKLHGMVSPKDSEGKLRVSFVLPPGLAYAQSFSIPNVGEERMRETVDLNLQMITPIPAANANMSAQIINETPDRYDFLGAFADKNEVSQFRDTLVQAGFSPVSFEFPAISITRLIRQSAKLSKGLILAFQISSEGLNLFISRDGLLYFDYFRSWQSIQGEDRSISRSAFDEVVIEEAKKVLNFSMSRFHENPAQIVVIAPGFGEEIGKIFQENFNLKATPLIFDQIAPAFFTSLGAALRGNVELGDEDLKMINLGGEGLESTIYKEQILNFLALWRNIAAGVLAILLISFIFAADFLSAQSKNLANQLNEFSYASGNKELADLTGKAVEFNSLVATIKSVRGNFSPWYGLLSHLDGVANANRIRISSIDLSSIAAPATLYGVADNYDAVLAFKNALSNDSVFTGVNLQITQISVAPDGTASFNVSFQFNLAP